MIAIIHAIANELHGLAHLEIPVALSVFKVRKQRCELVIYL
ncbi:hypothetical protein [Nostoc sp.]